MHGCQEEVGCLDKTHQTNNLREFGFDRCVRADDVDVATLLLRYGLTCKDMLQGTLMHTWGPCRLFILFYFIEWNPCPLFVLDGWLGILRRDVVKVQRCR